MWEMVDISVPVLMNMCNITLEVPRLSTFVFKKCPEKKDTLTIK